MVNKKYILIITLVALVCIAVVGGVYYWAAVQNKKKTPAPQPVTKTEEPPDINKLPAEEQLSSLLATKTSVPQIVVPSTINQSNVTQAQLPKSVSALIDPEASDLTASRVSYADKTTGYEIQYDLKKDFSSVILSYFFRIQTDSWKIVTTLKSAKAATFDLDSASFKAHVTLVQTADSQTTVKVSLISK